MQTKTITVQEALNELKVLDSRISRKTFASSLVGVESNSKLIKPNKSRLTVEDFKEEVNGAIQSLIDLINYRKALRSAVTLSNARTKVSVGGKELTVAEAIEYKTSIQNEVDLVKTLNNALNSAEITSAVHNEKIEKESLEKEKIVLGGEKERKGENVVLEAIRAKAESEKAKVVAPIVGGKDLAEYIEAKTNEIEDFRSNIDFKLTASNVTTEITVEW